ncbi:MAG: XdhC family protein [Pseudomonadota bacterium]
MLKKTPANRDPLQALLASPEPAVLAVIAGVEGPSYRPVGAMMTIFSPTQRAGTLSSGCIESDIALHAMDASDAGNPRMLRYGLGSPFMDIKLPCGGGLDILLIPEPDRTVLTLLVRNQAARKPCSLMIDIETGLMQIVDTGTTGRDGKSLCVRFEPDIRFLIFGKGPEASTFAALVQSAGYSNLLLSPDDETLEDGASSGCDTRHMREQVFPQDVFVDEHTAVVLFFHDHEWEPPILAGVLETSAFYIGAQGSQRASNERKMALDAMGITDEACSRLHGPVGLIPSARDAGTLAVSVLAEILAKAMVRTP